MSNTISTASAKDYMLMGLTAIIWASAFSAIKVAVPELGPLWLAAWRVLIGFLVMLPYVLWIGMRWPQKRALWLLIAITSLFNVVFPFFLISWSETKIDSGVAALLMGCGPFLGLIGSHFFTTDDRITPPKMLAVVLGFCGILTLIGYEVFYAISNASLMGQFAALSGACCYAVSGILVRRIDFPPIHLGFLVLAVGAIILFPLAFIFAGPPRFDIANQALFSLLYLGIFATGCGQLLRYTLIKRIGYSLFSLSLNLIPVLGVCLGALLLGEIITWRTIIALLFVLAGLFVSRMDSFKKT